MLDVRAPRVLYQHGLTHRDIKPANILVTRQGTVKLADLGLARPLGDEAWAVAEAGMAVGTPDYMSPEQTRGQTDLDIRSDLYSLGRRCSSWSPGASVPGQIGRRGDAPARGRPFSLARSGRPQPRPEQRRLRGDPKAEARPREDRYRDPDDLIFDLAAMIRRRTPVACGVTAGRGHRPTWRRASRPCAIAQAAGAPAPGWIARGRGASRAWRANFRNRPLLACSAFTSGSS